MGSQWDRSEEMLLWKTKRYLLGAKTQHLNNALATYGRTDEVMSKPYFINITVSHFRRYLRCQTEQKHYIIDNIVA
mgnify:CR=1 FL=1